MGADELQFNRLAGAGTDNKEVSNTRPPSGSTFVTVTVITTRPPSGSEMTWVSLDSLLPSGSRTQILTRSRHASVSADEGTVEETRSRGTRRLPISGVNEWTKVTSLFLR